MNGDAYGEARMLGMSHEEAQREAALAGPHGIVLAERVQPRTGRRSTCSRCGQAVESVYRVPTRSWVWAHVSTLASPMARRRVAGLLPGKVLA